MGPIHLGSQMGTVHGIYPWVNTLVMGNLMGRHFWVGCGFFSWGGGGGEEETPGQSTAESFSQDDTSLRTALFYVIYYKLSSGGFTPASSDHREGVPVSRDPG
jgi:hypothetical protein